MHFTGKRTIWGFRWVAMLCLFCLCAISAAQPRYRMGISLSAMEYNSRAYANMLSMDARVWNVGTTEAAPVDANGMPLHDADIYILDGTFAQVHGAYGFNGTYRLVFQGQADILAGGGTVQNAVYTAGTNTTTADIVVTELYPTLGLRLQNTRRTPGSQLNSGVTGLKLMRPTSIGAATSYDPSAVFTTEFLALHNRGEVLRSMDFVATNGNAQVNWADRQLPGNLGYYQERPGYWWQGKGGPWEDFIALCNAVDKDAWINVPALATDDYIIELCQMLKNQLEPGRKIYVEYSNEVWNFAFPTWYQLNDVAAAELQANPNSSINYDGACFNGDGTVNGGTATTRFWARRVMQVSDIFRSQFGDAMMHDGATPRVFPLFETQASWQVWIANGLTFLDSYYNNGSGNHVATPRPITSYLWGGGGSGYLHWFPENIYNDPNATVDDIFAGYEQSWTEQYNAMVPSTHWCAAFGLKRVAYEGGLSAFDGGPARAASLEAQLDPRIKDAWKRCADEFFRAGGEMYVHYMSVREDYGLLPFDAVIGNQPTPKLQGFDELVAAPSRPEPTIGFAVPGTINAGRYHVASDGWSTGTSDNPINMGSGYSWASYTIRSTAARTISLRLLASASTNGVATVYVNDHALGQLPLTAGVLSAPVSVKIPWGVSGIRVQRADGTFWLQSIVVDSAPEMSVALDPATIVSGATSTGTVTLDGPAPAGGRVVTLSSSSAAATVAATVTVPEGQTSVTFSVKAAVVDKTSSARIKAKVGKLSTSAVLTVEPLRIQSITVEPGSAVGGSKTAVYARVTLAAAPPTNVQVLISSSNPSAASVPDYFKVRAGETSGTFRVTTYAVSADATVKINAELGLSKGAANLIVMAPTVSSVALKPAAVPGGNSTIGTVTLTGPAPGAGVTLALKSSSKNATLPATLMIPAGASFATFDVATKPVPANATVTISAKLGLLAKTASLTVLAPVMTSFTVNPISVVGGSATPVVGTVTIGTSAPPQGLTIALSSSSTSASVPPTVRILAGATSATFPIAHSAVTANTRVSLTATLNGVGKIAKLTVKR